MAQLQDLNCTNELCVPAHPENLSKALPFLYRFGPQLGQSRIIRANGYQFVSPFRVLSLENQAFGPGAGPAGFSWWPGP